MAQKDWLRGISPKWIVRWHDNIYYWYIKNFPKRHAEVLFHEWFGRNINWEHPTILSEKGRWIQFKSDTSRWSLFADKYRVREYFNSLGLSEYLPKLYGVWDNADQIEFSTLPNSFVMKTNHGCGEVVVVKDKSSINEEELREAMGKHLKNRYGVWTAEPHYLKIKPVILAEELLPNTSNESKTMVDYKVFCSWGKPILLDLCYDRNPVTHHAKEAWYTPEWKKHDEWHTDNYVPLDLAKPKSLDKMYEMCNMISKDMPLVRIDFYDVNGRPYIGEITCTPNGYNPECLTDEAQRMIGDMIDLSPIRQDK